MTRGDFLLFRLATRLKSTMEPKYIRSTDTTPTQFETIGGSFVGPKKTKIKKNRLLSIHALR